LGEKEGVGEGESFKLGTCLMEIIEVATKIFAEQLCKGQP
jgi:hypothetical protein